MKSQSDGCVLVFVKSPVKGQVKTRLAADIGPEAALQLYESFVLDILGMLEGLKLPVRICFDPAGAEAQCQRWLGEHYSYVAQVGRDLGQRMKNAFIHSFDEGFEKAVLIGSDLPDLPGPYLHEALEALASSEAVIGPSSDGGYYLIGFSQDSFLPIAFDGIPWSTSTVFKRTLDILTKHGLNVHLLPEWYDVDTAADVQSLLLRSRGTTFENSKTYRYLASKGWWSKNVRL